MPSIARLPDELLFEVFVLASDLSIEVSFAIAQVSRRWRSVAHSSPLLWSSFCLASKTDSSRLPTVLKLSGPSALLDIELSGVSVCLAVMEALVPYAARIRSFTARPAGVLLISAPLFDGTLEFPCLEKLRIFPRDLWETPLCVASAPLLRVLKVSSVILGDVTSLVTLVSPTLEVIRLVRCVPLSTSVLVDILERCPRLVHLSFSSSDYGGDATPFNPGPGLANIPRRPLAPALRSLNLHMSRDDTVEVLGTGFADVVLPEIGVFAYKRCSAGAVAQLVDSLIRGLDALVSFAVKEDHTTIVLRDTAGRVRSISGRDRDRSFVLATGWDIEDVWRVLAERHAITTSLQHLEFGTKDWASIAAALVARPLQPGGGGITIRVIVDATDVRMARSGGGLRPKRILAVSGLRCIEIESAVSAFELPAAAVRHVLQYLHHDPDPARPCKLVLHGATPKRRGAETDGSQSDDWKKAMGHDLALDPSIWELSFK